MAKTFENLLLLGRPASGKSEFMDFMKHVPATERAQKYHLAQLQELDDFPWIWEKFMEDNLWEKAGYPRRYSTGGNNPGLHAEAGALFDFCMQKFNAEYAQKYQSNGSFFNDHTLLIEFARGGKNAYQKALNVLSPEMLKRSAILFIYVDYAESCRRNDARYQEKLAHSILAHKVPDHTMQTFYQTHDWLEWTEEKPDGYVTANGIKVPFVTMNNMPEITDPALLEKRYGAALQRLNELRA